MLRAQLLFFFDQFLDLNNLTFENVGLLWNFRIVVILIILIIFFFIFSIAAKLGAILVFVIIVILEAPFFYFDILAILLEFILKEVFHESSWHLRTIIIILDLLALE